MFEIIPHLPRLLRIRRKLIDRVLAEQPAVYVGVDAKEFNLRIAPRFKASGIPTVQYVSPQVWAWRQGRVHTIGRAVDLVLCLLPFEKPFYDAHSVHAEFVGHPLADQIPLTMDAETRAFRVGPAGEGQYVAVLPGSRHGEVSRLSPDFAATMAWLLQRRPQLRFIAALANDSMREIFEAALDRVAVQAPTLRDRVTLVEWSCASVMAASDAVLLASGTATLEATLVKRPMVVAYRLGAADKFPAQALETVQGAVLRPAQSAGRPAGGARVLQRRGAAPTCWARRCSSNSSVPIAISSCKLSPPSTRPSGATPVRARRMRSWSCW